MAKSFAFFLIFFALVFSAGFLTGYFLDRSSIVYTASEITNLKNEVENMQIQEMFLSGESVDCSLMFSAMGKTSYDLYDLVARLRQTSPESPDFAAAKRQADLLSLKAWLIARRIQDKCSTEIVPVLFFYSDNCRKCKEQNSVLQAMKAEHNQTLVYAVDYDSDETAIALVKAAYNITAAPAIIIGHNVYGEAGYREIEGIICNATAC